MQAFPAIVSTPKYFLAHRCAIGRWPCLQLLAPRRIRVVAVHPEFNCGRESPYPGLESTKSRIREIPMAGFEQTKPEHAIFNTHLGRSHK